MIGSTTHDRPLSINGYFCIPYEATELKAIEKNSTLDPNNVELVGVQGTINQGTIMTHRLAYKEIRTLKGVDWRNPPSSFNDHPLAWTQVGTSGESSVDGEGSWSIQEQSTIERKLAQTPNKLTAPVCRHNFCDAGCGLNLVDHQFDLYITEVFYQMSFRVNYAPPNFNYGFATFTTEPNANASYPVALGTGGIITLSDIPEFKLEVGQGVRMTRGCAKTFSYCQSIYNNSINFGGIPPDGDWIPGNNKYQAPDVQRI